MEIVEHVSTICEQLSVFFFFKYSDVCMEGPPRAQIIACVREHSEYENLCTYILELLFRSVLNSDF